MKNIKVFISSVVSGYENYRDAVEDAIARLSHQDGFNIKQVGNEKFSAFTESSQRARLDLVNESDIFLGIYGKRYGSKDSSTGISPTHEEFKMAKAKKKHILVFVEDIPDEKREPKQRDFFREVGDYVKDHLWTKFKIEDDLKLEVYRALKEEYSKLLKLEPKEKIDTICRSYADDSPENITIGTAHVQPLGEKHSEDSHDTWLKKKKEQYPGLNVALKAFDERYLFSWDNDLGNDSESLLRSIMADLDIDWAENAEIRKSDDRKIIRIFKDENLAEIKLEEKREKVSLKISDGKTLDLKVKKENGKLNIYDERKSPLHLFILVDNEGGKGVWIYIFTQNAYPIIETNIDFNALVNVLIPQWEDLKENVISQNGEKVKSFGDNLYNYLLKYLFSLKRDYKQYLIPGGVHDKVKKEFKDKNLPLSNKAKVSLIDEKQWMIEDGKMRYRIDDIETQLNICRDNNVLPLGCDKTCEVWVYCEDKDIYPLWEWLYEGYGMENQDGFFWGDKFHIIRIPNERILNNCDFEKSNYPCQINNVAIIIDDFDCHCTADDTKCFKGQRKVTFITLQEIINGSKNLKEFDCIHLVLSGRQVTKELISSCRQALRNCKLKFLFLNIRAPNDCSSKHLTQFKELFTSSAEIWIDSLDLPNDSAPQFTKYFYKEFWSNKKNVAAAATKTRKNIERNAEGLNTGKELWRLAYVVTGNPCTKISWATD